MRFKVVSRKGKNITDSKIAKKFIVSVPKNTKTIKSALKVIREKVFGIQSKIKVKPLLV